MKPKIRVPLYGSYNETYNLARKLKLNTVCEEAVCPNISECWSKKHAAIMILGSVCTRSCRFCNIKTGRPDKVDPHEPERVAKVALELGLKHIVITSVTRDDLPDGGASHFAECIFQIRKISPKTTIEVLTPDFLRKDEALEIVVKAKPDVYNHNVETVLSLYKKVRPSASYRNSLDLLKKVKDLDKTILTKSGIMVGLGESREEVFEVMGDLRNSLVDFLTIGQYLRPTDAHLEVVEFISDKLFDEYKQKAIEKGFTMVSSSPLTRSSYHADKYFAELKAKSTI